MKIIYLLIKKFDFPYTNIEVHMRRKRKSIFNIVVEIELRQHLVHHHKLDPSLDLDYHP